MKTVCLFGNGTSIAYNPELNIWNLTDLLRGAFKKSGDPYLKDLADGLDLSNYDKAFEQLLGAFDEMTDKLWDLPGLAKTGGMLRGVVQAFNDILTGVYRRGVGITLGHISDLSADGRSEFYEVTLPFTEALVKVWRKNAFDLTVGTLNYDCQLMAGFLRHTLHFCDMADWRYRRNKQLPNISDPKMAIPLRTEDNFGDSAVRGYIRFLQMHGSLGWLKDTASTDNHSIYKFDLKDLRDGKPNFWRVLADGHTDWTPTVVLTSEKTKIINEWPFRLAYEVFEKHLAEARRVLIAGYGLADAPLNTRLRKYLPRFTDKNKLLIVGRRGDDEPKDKATRRMEELVWKSLNLYPGSYRVNVDGIPGVIQSEDWERWSE